MNKIALSIILTVILTNVVYAEEHSIAIENMRFSTPFMAVKPGDTIKFSNKSNVDHSIIGKSPTFEFDIKNFKSGKTVVVAFPKKGVIDLTCNYHAGMEMSIFVR